MFLKLLQLTWKYIRVQNLSRDSWHELCPLFWIIDLLPGDNITLWEIINKYHGKKRALTIPGLWVSYNQDVFWNCGGEFRNIARLCFYLNHNCLTYSYSKTRLAIYHTSLSTTRWVTWKHYNDVIVSAMASQITSPTIVYSTVYSRHRSKETPKLRVTGLCVGN